MPVCNQGAARNRLVYWQGVVDGGGGVVFRTTTLRPPRGRLDEAATVLPVSDGLTQH